MNEDDYIKEFFRKNFSSMSKKRIALYGLGQNTKTILNNFSNYNIVGILDGFKTSGFFEGKKVISLEDTLREKIEIIIIIARANSTKIIIERINEFCKKNDIKLYDIYKNDLLLNHKSIDKFDKYFLLSTNMMKTEILKHDVISFDVFDTLLMRKTLFPKDVFALVEKELEIHDFYRTRIEAERELYAKGNPKLADIYQLIGIKLQIPPNKLEQYKQLELAIEQKVLLPRNQMVDMLHFAIKNGKNVYLVSNMYLSAYEIEKILKKNHITGYSELLVSSEYNTTKSKALFDILKKHAQGNSYLHIGDDTDADNLFAEMKGIDTFPIKSALDMLEISSYHTLLQKAKTLDERLMLGLFLAKIFNDPFSLYATKGRPVIDSVKKLSYYFIAPLLSAFLFWMVNETHEKYDRILWGARDGYLFSKMYHLLTALFPKLHFPKSDYFLISRISAIAASLKDENDIRYATNIGFSGTPDELLQKRFFLTKAQILPIAKDETLDNYILRHKTSILNKAAELRERYLLYIKTLGLNYNERLAFFDLVSSGTCQMCLNDILGRETDGFYFIHSIEHYKKKEQLKTKSFIETGLLYQLHSYLSTNYELIENTIVPNRATLHYFNETGKPIYETSKYTKAGLKYISEVQKTVMEYLEDFLKLAGTFKVNISETFADYFYSMIQQKYSDLQDCAMPHMTFHDDFTNRIFVLDNTLG